MADTTEWASFYPGVLPDAPGAPDSLVSNAVRNAAIEFCKRTLAWVQNFDAISVLPNEGEYLFSEFDLPKETVVVKILQAWFDGKPIYPKDQDELSRLYSDKWADQTASAPLYYTQDSERGVIIVPKTNVSVANGIALRVALKPSADATGISTTLYEEYHETIAQGALARLLMQNKPWGNPAAAGINKGLFDSAIGSVKVSVSKGRVRSRQRVTAQFL